MKPNQKLILCATALAFVGHAMATPVTIMGLPYPIVNPGTYILAADLTYTATDNTAAISISTNISGPVILDLKGHTTIGAGGNSVGVGIGVFAGASGANTQPITIRNGTLKNFGWGVWAESQGALIDITVNNITIPAPVQTGILFSRVSDSLVSNCAITTCQNGIQDETSAGGNHYSNVTFVNVSEDLFVTGQNGGLPTVLEHCGFAEPPTP